MSQMCSLPGFKFDTHMSHEKYLYPIPSNGGCWVNIPIVEYLKWLAKIPIPQVWKTIWLWIPDFIPNQQGHVMARADCLSLNLSAETKCLHQSVLQDASLLAAQERGNNKSYLNHIKIIFKKNEKPPS